MSRHINCFTIGWRDGHAPVCTTDEFYRDRLLKVFYHDREFSFTIEIVWPRVMIEILCCDRAWGGGGRGLERMIECATARITHAIAHTTCAQQTRYSALCCTLLSHCS